MGRGTVPYSGQAAKCSRIAPPGHGLDATSGQEHAEAGQEYAEVEHKHAEAEHKYDAQGVQSVPASSPCPTILEQLAACPE